jgi:hypothetical protein
MAHSLSTHRGQQWRSGGSGSDFTGTFALTSIGRLAILSEEVTTQISPADRFAARAPAIARP